jgi:four helix bundle protein
MSYREQFIWKRGIQLSINCYKLTENFPKSELYGLTSQIRRASVSVPSNIAEGYGRRTQNEYIQFLHIALGSLRELDTQLIIAKEVKLATPELFDPVLEEVDRMQGILVSTIQKLTALRARQKAEGRRQEGKFLDHEKSLFVSPNWV